MSFKEPDKAKIARLRMERDTLRSQIDFMYEDAHNHPRMTARNWARKFKERDNIYKGVER